MHLGHAFTLITGPVNGNMYFVIVDAYIKFPEVVKMKSITSSCTIRALREIFSRHGIPKSIVSDNGPQFISSEFKTFCENNGISYITTAVYKPSTNGQCERVVQIVKSALRQARLTSEEPDTTLPRFLLRYRITPAQNSTYDNRRVPFCATLWSSTSHSTRPLPSICI